MAKRPLLHDGTSLSSEEGIAPMTTGRAGAGPDSYGTATSDEDNIQLDSINNDKSAGSPCDKAKPGFVYVLTFFSAIGGFLFGYDTGVVSGAMILIAPAFNLTTFMVELVVSITIGAAALFAMIGGFTNDWFGRKPTVILASLVFTGGAIILGAAVDTTMLLIGRFVVGMGIGMASMTVPMYIAESAPPQVRGRLVTLNNIFITGGQVVAGLVAGAFSYDHDTGWRFMLGLAAVPSVVQLVGFIFMPESPRWLVSKGRTDDARRTLKRIRGSTDVEEELEEIITTCREELAMRELHGSQPVLCLMLTTPHVRKALIVGCGLQMFQQITGINTVMYYSATIIKMSGVQDESTAIWLAAVTAAVNFIFTFVGLYLVERIGRRRLTLGSLAGTTVALVVLAIGFQLAASNSPPITVFPQVPLNDTSTTECLTYNSCNDCMENLDCGYCYIETNNGAANGSCLPVAYTSNDLIDTSHAEYGRCSGEAKQGSPDMSWAYDYCPTAYAWMATFGLVLYLACFAPGMGPMPWTVNSEIYPMWARSTGNAMSTATNWIFNLLISMTFLTLTEILTRYGAFYLYTSFAVIGFIFLYCVLPETKGKTLEQVEQLFMQPWC